MKQQRRPAGSSRRANVSAPVGSLAAPPWWKHPALLAAVIAVLLYLPALGYDFVRDDHDLIRANPFLRREGWLGKLLASDFWGASSKNSGMWRPAVVLSYWIDGRVFQWQPLGFHAVNLAAHALVSAAVAWLALGSGVPTLAALVAGIWFATMPAHVESVAWISGRTDVLCALFFALALILDQRARDAGRTWPGFLAPLALLVALLSKEAAVPFIGVVAVAEWMRARGRRSLVAFARWLTPYVLVTLAFLATHEALSARWTQPPSVDAATVAQVRSSAWIMVPHYVAMLWPWYPHSPDIALALESAGSPMVVAGLVVTLAALAALGVLAWRRAPAAVPLAVFVLPVMMLAVLAWVRGYWTFAERLVYLPSIGAAWLLGLVVGAAQTRNPRLARVAIAVAALLVAGSAVQAWRLVPQWHDDSTMFAAMTVAQPRNARAKIGYANQLAAAGRDAEALEQLDAAERLEPRLAEIPASRAVVHFRHGKWNEVHANARRALELDPGYPQARLLEATALLRLRRLDEAARVLDRLRADRPDDPAVDGIWGQVLLLRGEPAQAIPFLTRAARWHHDDASVSYALGVACQMTGAWSQARDAFATTVRIDPAYYEGWLRLATVAHQAGDAATRDQAIAQARTLPEARDGRVERLAREVAGP